MIESINLNNSQILKKFTYASPQDGWMKKMVINTLEFFTGRRLIQRVYNEIMAEDPTPWNVYANGLSKLDIKVDYDEVQLEKIPTEGPLIFVANHPYGVVDGAILCDLVCKKRKDYFLLINEVLSHEPVLDGHLIPIDFRGDKRALQTNLSSKHEAIRRLNKGEVLTIFPSGAVATSTKLFGEAEEFPWRRFISARIHESKSTVVPVYFHGCNSRLFQFVSKISMNLRLGLLLFEVVNKKGKTIQVEIGDPIPYSEMEKIKDRQKLIDYLKDKTMNMVSKQRTKKTI